MGQYLEITPEKWAVEQIRLAAHLLSIPDFQNFYAAHVCCAAIGALNAALVSALTGTDGLGALSEKAHRQRHACLYNQSSEIPSSDNVLSVRDLLNHAVTRQLISLTEDNTKKIARLIDLRDRIVHPRPETHWIEVELILSTVPVVVRLTTHLVTEFHGHRLEESERNELFSQLENFTNLCERSR
jgi:hypothetical protein